MAETRWTQVILSKGESPEARLALKDLASAYYNPVFRFIRDRTQDHEKARDLTQQFFERVLDRYGFEGADPERGRFRSFLLGAVKHFLAEQNARERRQKRGGDIVHESLDAPNPNTGSTAPGLQVADPDAVMPDEVFDRHWAHTVLDRALIKLENEYDANGKIRQFTVLQPWLAGGADQPQADAAAELEMNESALRVAVHRLRKRFRQCVRAELSQTLAPGISVDEEMRHLMSALCAR